MAAGFWVVNGILGPLPCRLESTATLKKGTGFASVLWSSCLAMLAVGANSTAIMAALPNMRTDLFLSSAGVEWAVNAISLCRTSGRTGHRRTFR